MKTVEDYENIRKAFYLEGLSIREICRRMHHSRRLIRKALNHAQPEGYQLKKERAAPAFAAYKQKIEELIKESDQMPRKQRYTGYKIYQLLQAEGYQGCEGSVHNYVSQQRKSAKKRQAYLPLEFDAGQDAQVDWGEVVAEIGGERRKVQIFVMHLNHSKVRFVTPALALRASAVQVWRFHSKSRKRSSKDTFRHFTFWEVYHGGSPMTI